LDSEKRKTYRAQANNLRESLEKYINDHADYDHLRMYHSGSVEKGTALSTINDMDVAVYLKAAKEDVEEGDLLTWLRDRLIEAKPQNMDASQILPIEAGAHCVTITYKGTGLDVDMVPVIYDGEPDGKGYLIPWGMDDRVLTSIPLHLAFIRKRKEEHPDHFAQVVRLVKWWAKLQKGANQSFRFKSFMLELICAHLVDTGKMDVTDYPTALAQFFGYILNSGLKERVIFADNYDADDVPDKTDVEIIGIFDPVNPDNNVASRYTEENRMLIVDEAQKAFDAITQAKYSITKGEAAELWKRVFGHSFFIAI